jgi:3-deoxy-D-manno-octulosonic-acid transferase
LKYAFNLIYASVLLLLLPWIVWRVAVQKKNRRGWGEKLLGWVPKRDSTRPCIWIHGVSVGEINLLQPLVSQLQLSYPDHELTISTTTDTGFALAKKHFDRHVVFYCPTDFSWAISNAIRRVRPNMIVLTELELWPNLIAIASKFSVPVALINGRMSLSSFHGYFRFRWLAQRMLKKINLIAAQSVVCAERFRRLGAPAARIHVTGNIKFDTAVGGRSLVETKRLSTLMRIRDDEVVFLAGSTQENEDLMAATVYRALAARGLDLRLILVPRHPERCGRLASLLNELHLPFVFRSGQNDANLPTATPSARPIVVVDVIGELSHWWGRANLGFVGGSTGKRGGQNMIEPAALGVPICFGPRTENFQSVVELLLERDGARVVHDRDELERFIVDALADPDWAVEMGRRAQQLVYSQRGACQRTANLLGRFLRQRHDLPAKMQVA